ncbi:rod shape-determining protein RodA [Desulfosarcina ovata subsp. sediminis]|uniref:Peptidoglycan glycosyltransferase RodA n=1 Tax=Desulfosarcina ovata subsp. sediminis TaxID=885957 RepID=A0A5K7ZZQ0_9BACT|nr:rod shape-determining protein RodA [Desulfosarcina ovata]BBO85646.1 rod shape-determining protein RodA [Desulfosarcina ovata subsp. sediminis]
MFDRRLLQCFDWGLLTLTLAIGGIGLVVLYSAVSAGAAPPDIVLFKKQLIWYGGGMVIMVLSFLFDYKQFERFANAIYLASVASLVAVLFFGKYVGGSRRWLSLGPFSLQPSEMAKVAVIIVLARYYAKMISTEGMSFRDLMMPVFLTAIPFALIVRQPDLGTAMVIALIAGVMTLFAKIERRTFSWLVATFTMLVPLVWFFLRGYQKQRILTFLNPDRDPLGAGYHIIQSKIAIGSGMLTGKGFLKGTQNTLSFLPEQHTDFIFSVLSEEWGMAGSLTLIVLFMIMIAWGLNIAGRCRDPFGIILSVGVTAMIAWQVLINIGMVMGLMPVVGVTLPFVSYGGSSIITMLMGIGLLMNVSMRRFKFE